MQDGRGQWPAGGRRLTCIWGPSAMLLVAGMVLLAPCPLLPTLHISTLPGREKIAKYCRLSLWLASRSLDEAVGSLEKME